MTTELNEQLKAYKKILTETVAGQMQKALDGLDKERFGTVEKKIIDANRATHKELTDRIDATVKEQKELSAKMEELRDYGEQKRIMPESPYAAMLMSANAATGDSGKKQTFIDRLKAADENWKKEWGNNPGMRAAFYNNPTTPSPDDINGMFIDNRNYQKPVVVHNPEALRILDMGLIKMISSSLMSVKTVEFSPSFDMSQGAMTSTVGRNQGESIKRVGMQDGTRSLSIEQSTISATAELDEGFFMDTSVADLLMSNMQEKFRQDLDFKIMFGNKDQSGGNKDGGTIHGLLETTGNRANGRLSTVSRANAGQWELGDIISMLEMGDGKGIFMINKKMIRVLFGMHENSQYKSKIFEPAANGLYNSSPLAPVGYLWGIPVFRHEMVVNDPTKANSLLLVNWGAVQGLTGLHGRDIRNGYTVKTSDQVTFAINDNITVKFQSSYGQRPAAVSNYKDYGGIVEYPYVTTN